MEAQGQAGWLGSQWGPHAAACLPTSRAPAPPAPLPAAGLYSKTNPQYAPLGQEPFVLYPSYDDKNSGEPGAARGPPCSLAADLLPADFLAASAFALLEHLNKQVCILIGLEPTQPTPTPRHVAPAIPIGTPCRRACHAGSCLAVQGHPQ